MSISLTVLGGAAAWPNPGQGCSSYLVQSGGTSLLLDCGPDTLLELRKHIAYETLDAVVISHCHADHILDLIPYRYGLVYGTRRPAKPIPLWLPPAGERVLNALAAALGGQGEEAETFWSTAFEPTPYDPASRITIGELTISFALTQHYVDTYAIRVEHSDGGSLFYSADTGAIEPVLGLATRADLAIVEATLDRQPDGPPEERGHLTPADAGLLAQRAGVTQLLLTHLWYERPQEEVLKLAAKHFDGPIRFAEPGLRIHV